MTLDNIIINKSVYGESFANLRPCQCIKRQVDKKEQQAKIHIEGIST